MKNETGKYGVVDIRNAPKKVKIYKIKNSVEIPAKDLKNHLYSLDKGKIYVVCDWTGGTILGEEFLLYFYKNGFESYESAGFLEG